VKLRLRARSISPHHQIWLLFGVAIVTLAVIVGGMLVALGPTQGQLNGLDAKLIPTIQRIDTASAGYARTAQTVQQLAVETDPVKRNAALASLAASRSAAQIAWDAYRRLSVSLPGEGALQRSFEADRKLALAAGAQLFTGSDDSVAAFASVGQLSDTVVDDLNKIKQLYQTQVHTALHNASQDFGATQRDLLLLAVAALIGLSLGFGLAAHAARGREIKVEVLNRTLENDSTRNALEARLQRSLEMVHSEEASYALVNRALSRCAPGLAAELLLADSSRAHFSQVTKTAELDIGGCAVMSPAECPAASRGQTQVWVSSSDLDSCPYLQDRANGDCSAVCVPVSIAGNTVGVLHATAADGEPPTSNTIVNVELISRKAGERIGMLRAFSKSEVQAHTDPLTGLMNRRSLEVAVHALAEQDLPYVVAYGDLDHFKQLNDVYGHDAGDRALRLFARVLRDSLRPSDIPARYGGEEFVVVIPECSVPDAVSLIDRLRENLAAAQHGGTVPPFTVSFGVASGRLGTPFDDTVEIADGALLEAKSQGRDRVVVAGSDNDGPDVGVGQTVSEPRLVA
jgi:diguanylate cyclase (GGDEF)-like protein